ncbi:hypothetical protein BKA62DRAFT_715642 [Auriculariales sp. MPI-PUGE-AT-0066]|nr:hypothetical protein BKA62DRAFT_715642 [Auriculariales sp. MPI-PUGE-AT-0066]
MLAHHILLHLLLCVLAGVEAAPTAKDPELWPITKLSPAVVDYSTRRLAQRSTDAEDQLSNDRQDTTDSDQGQPPSDHSRAAPQEYADSVQAPHMGDAAKGGKEGWVVRRMLAWAPRCEICA